MVRREDYEALQLKLRLAQFEIGKLKAILHGKSSERLPAEDPAQLKLLMEQEAALAHPPVPPATEGVLEDAGEAKGGKTRPRRPRHPFPENVETLTTVLDLPEAEKTCPHCGEAKCRVGQEVSEALEVVPARFVRIQTVRPRYACRCGRAGVAVAPLPPRLVDKGRCGPGLLAQILLAKYMDHLPLFRQEQIFQSRHGVHLTRQTMAGQVEQMAQWLKPIWRVMREEMLRGGYLQVDETPVKVRDPDVGGKTATGYLWVYAEPGGDVLFDFHTSRGLAPPLEWLKGFEGVIQTDGYQVYESLGRQMPQLGRIGCWAHARRKFIEAMEEDREGAAWFVHQIRRLYALERQAREEALGPAQRHGLRLARAPEVLRGIKERLDAHAGRHPDKTPMAKAVHYALNQWEALNGYLADGRLEIDNNLVENAIRPTAVGKKNWLFLGHPEAGWRSAVVYSILVSCRRRGINPAEYLADIFARLPGMKSSELSQIVPARWQKQPA